MGHVAVYNEIYLGRFYYSVRRLVESYREKSDNNNQMVI
jgi:hypothetical protein